MGLVSEDIIRRLIRITRSSLGDENKKVKMNSDQAVLTTNDSEIVIWEGMGVGKPKGKGMVISWRGARAYQTSSQKLSRLNNVRFFLKLKLMRMEWDSINTGNGKWDN
jgi:hypothetical protein